MNVPISTPYGQIIKLYGKANLINNPDNKDDEPKIIHKRFSLNESSTVFIDSPPYLTIVNWIIIVAIMMIKKSGLLKKFSKTLDYSGLSFLALISLKTWSKTNTLKKIQ